MTIKKIITNACAVIIVLYNCASFANICVPGEPNSTLIKKDKQVPIIINIFILFGLYLIIINLFFLLKFLQFIKIIKMISIE